MASIPLLLSDILPNAVELLVFFLAQWPFALSLSCVIAHQLADESKYRFLLLVLVGFVPAALLSNALWQITPFSWT